MSSLIHIENIAYNIPTKYIGGLKIVKRKSFPNTSIEDLKKKLQAMNFENNYFETDFSKTKWKNAQYLGDSKLK